MDIDAQATGFTSSWRFYSDKINHSIGWFLVSFFVSSEVLNNTTYTNHHHHHYQQSVMNNAYEIGHRKNRELQTLVVARKVDAHWSRKLKDT